MVINRCCHPDKKKSPSPLSPGPDESGPGYPFSETPFKEKFHPKERYFSELGKDKTGPKVVKTMEHYVANEWDAKDRVDKLRLRPVSFKIFEDIKGFDTAFPISTMLFSNHI